MTTFNKFNDNFNFRFLPAIAAFLILLNYNSGDNHSAFSQNLLVMKIESSAFRQGESIPSKYTCQGEDINPPLNFADVPAAAKSLALIMDDPDAPMGTWVHGVLWNISPQTTAIPENSVPDGVVQGKNSWGNSKYGGPARHPARIVTFSKYMRWILFLRCHLPLR